MKKILGIFLASALIWSCGSQFSKSKYDRFMWNRSQGKEDKTVNTVTEEETRTDTRSFNDQNAVSDEKIQLKTNEDKQLLTLHSKKEDKKENSVALKGNASNFSNKKSSANSLLPGLSTVKKAAGKIKKAKSNSIEKLNHMQGDGSTADLITLIVLIILILLIFALLDELLGGALTWILGIVILVLIIYFLLRYLGLV